MPPATRKPAIFAARGLPPAGVRGAERGPFARRVRPGSRACHVARALSCRAQPAGGALLFAPAPQEARARKLITISGWHNRGATGSCSWSAHRRSTRPKLSPRTWRRGALPAGSRSLTAPTAPHPTALPPCSCSRRIPKISVSSSPRPWPPVCRRSSPTPPRGWNWGNTRPAGAWLGRTTLRPLSSALGSPDPTRLASRGQHGREWMARDYSWERVARILHEFYGQLRHA